MDNDKNNETVSESVDQVVPQLPTNFLVYLLRHSSSNLTYVGMSNDLKNRIRRHNGEIKGGAHYTTVNKKDGYWIIHGTIQGLTKSLSLSFEKKIKIRSAKMKGPAIERRLKAIDAILSEYNQEHNTNYSFELFSQP